MKKIYLTLLLGIFLIAFATADLGTFQQNDCIDVKANLEAVSVNVSIYSPTSLIIVEDDGMNNVRGNIWNYTFCNTTANGEYTYDYCDEGGDNCKENIFTITYSGLEVTQGQSTIYAVLLFLLVLFFIGTFFGIGMLPSSNEKNPEGEIISISYLKYFRSVLWFLEWIFLMGIMFLASNLAFAFLGETLFANLFFIIYRIMFMMLPVIVLIWGVWFYIKFVQDKDFKKMFERGFIPGSTRL